MNIDAILSTLVSLSVIVGFFWGILRYVIRNELQTYTESMATFRDGIKELRLTVAALNEVVTKLQSVQTDMDRRLIVLEQTTKALHSRVDDFDKRLMQFVGLYSYEHTPGGVSTDKINNIGTPHWRVKRD